MRFLTFADAKSPAGGLGSWCRGRLPAIGTPKNRFAVITLANFSRRPSTQQKDGTEDDKQKRGVSPDVVLGQIGYPPSSDKTENEEEKCNASRCAITHFSVATSADLSAPWDIVHTVGTGHRVIDGHDFIPLIGTEQPLRR